MSVITDRESIEKAYQKYAESRRRKRAPSVVDRGFHKPPSFSFDIFLYICKRFGVDLIPPHGTVRTMDDQQYEISHAVMAVQVVSREFFKRYFAFNSVHIERNFLAVGFEFCRTLMTEWFGKRINMAFAVSALVMELYLYVASNPGGIQLNYRVACWLLHMVLMEGLSGGVMTLNEKDVSEWNKKNDRLREKYAEAYVNVSPCIDGLRDPYDSFSNQYLMGRVQRFYKMVIPSLVAMFNFEKGQDEPTRWEWEKDFFTSKLSSAASQTEADESGQKESPTSDQQQQHPSLEQPPLLEPQQRQQPPPFEEQPPPLEQPPPFEEPPSLEQQQPPPLEQQSPPLEQQSPPLEQQQPPLEQLQQPPPLEQQQQLEQQPPLEHQQQQLSTSGPGQQSV